MYDDREIEIISEVKLPLFGLSLRRRIQEMEICTVFYHTQGSVRIKKKHQYSKKY